MRSLLSKAPFLLLLIYIGALLYGTLIPFRFSWNPGRDKSDSRNRVEWVPFTRLCPAHGILCPRDNGLNFVIFIPVGALASIMQRVGEGAGRRVLRAGLFGLCLSLLIETTQYFIPLRFPSTTDLLLNVAGAFLGGGMSAGIGMLRINRFSIGAS